MEFKDDDGSDNLKIFLNEVKVGGTPGIEKVGPRIYAWRIIRSSNGKATSGQYIMDSFTKGDSSLTSYSFSTYVNRFFRYCPGPTHPLIKMLKESLKNFYVITQGYHGDLHTGNIAVLFDPKSRDVKKVIIYDYGSHKKFKSKVSASMCLEDIMDVINREYKKSFNKYKYSQNSKFPVTSSVNVYYPNRSQPRRSNTQLLKAMIPTGNIYNTFESQPNKTFYNLLSNRPKKIKHFNNSFVSPRTFAQKTGTRIKNVMIKNQMKVHAGMSGNEVKKQLVERFKRVGTQMYNQNKQRVFPSISRATYNSMVKNLLLNQGQKLYKKRRALIKKREPTATNENVKRVLRGMNAASLKLTNEDYKLLMNYINGV
jgi:hypothetical protein